MAKNQICVNYEQLIQVDSSIVQQFYELNEGKKARMLEVLDRYFNDMQYPKDERRYNWVKAYYILHRKNVLSWGVVHKHWRGDLCLDVYTNPVHRGKGYGSAIVQVVRNTTRGNIGSADYRSTISKPLSRA